ncbi:3-isopropylmalate dehydratase small subunit [Lyngbya confervoides]|uniref:3-isopropylmalate dehydratase small subunit n=1 Tax=Lyngbya confervoides BDU141951 TaxID=1574623 RepID=A0ABD4T6T9_9CYAN|nr:3-isopropylmalate dehydratase small subunit [Lyngbya confervoides]MCM1984361.1 3-isopropylmalate dehydratase small subunit [Lyngbya confervoides BDU141951]
MSQIHSISGRGIPLSGNDIDTDRIIPARFLKCITFDGLGEQVFADDRAQAQGQHPFDRSPYQGASVLVVNRNFGCGSSREHAPQAIARWGIQTIIGESFAEIFFGNCIALGIPCVTVESETAQALQSSLQRDPTLKIRVDLEALQVTWGTLSAPLEIAEGPRQMFLSGTWDACGQLVSQAQNTQAIAASLPYTHW